MAGGKEGNDQKSAGKRRKREGVIRENGPAQPRIYKRRKAPKGTKSSGPRAAGGSKVED